MRACDAAQVESLRPRVVTLLQRALLDNDDEVFVVCACMSVASVCLWVGPVRCGLQGLSTPSHMVTGRNKTAWRCAPSVSSRGGQTPCSFPS